MSSSDYRWEEVSPGRWERDIDEVEQFYTSLAKAYEGSGRTYFAITGFISFSVETKDGVSAQDTAGRVEDALRKAWIHLRYDHPTIGSRVEWNPGQQRCKKIYETLSGPRVNAWLQSTFQIVPNTTSGLEWCNSDPPVPKLPTLFLIWGPAADGRIEGDLVLRSPHDIIDGVGALMLFDNLFTHAASAYKQGPEYVLPQFGPEFANLSPPFRVAAGLRPSMPADQRERFETMMAYNAFMKQDRIEIATMPYKKGEQLPGKHQRVALTLSTDQTTKLLAACRRTGLSVTHAYHAAIALAVRDLQERREQERLVRYINYSLINERAHCLPPYDTRLHAAAVYHSVSCKSLVIDTKVPSILASPADPNPNREEYGKIAKTVKDFYLEIRNDYDHIQMIPAWFANNTIPYPQGDGAPPVPEPNHSPSVSISSLGVVDKVISPSQGAFELENPWVTGEELGTGLGLFLGTWKGQLTSSAAYNDAWHDRDEVMEFIQRCNSIMMQGLGVL
ncbi:uncharacterized protein ACLA_043770 [Aspergillus clavatus NRRL 1]|uniref:Acyltransferase n=1 Tax=Aspergillus clavatus (strain ATCC 1007 / CBS 513.65 / DSM 816 / NCTC 3887 / NRRL 1 / QM 1276 / 107) TaxID=344612 RepID=A1C8M0_ASPCL|nr:uncharacterized protein ACLA_043770 [Aspergillus clavatus NRRL 1]EAW13657.1 conserved hypothetical protein [Aspergillus clavatus NRRL 1]